MNAPTQGAFDHLNQSALEVEQGLLGACLTYPMAAHAAITQRLEPQHFNEEPHKLIWSAVVDLALAGTLPSPLTLGNRLGNGLVAPGLTMRAYLAQIAADTFCPANAVVDFARQIMRGWALRNVALLSGEAREHALRPGADAGRIISQAIQDLDTVRASLDQRAAGPRSALAATTALTDKIQRRMDGEIIDTALATGLIDLDRKLGGGLKGGELVLMAGRPGMGKTAVASSMGRQMSAEGTPGLFFSQEMPEAQICGRLISDHIFGHGKLSANRILYETLTVGEAELVFDAQRDFENLQLEIDDSSSITVGEIGARARASNSRLARIGKKLGYIVVDYLQLVRPSERYRGNRNLEVGEVTSSLKRLAKDMDIPVILLSQLSRKVEERDDKRPRLADLRDSGEIEQDADVVIFLFREAYYLENDPKRNLPDIAARLDEVQFDLEAIIAKNRMGSIGTVNLFFNPAYFAVRNGRARA